MASTTTKLHGRAFYESIGCPKYVVAPMVDQSEFAWRLLTRSFLPPDLRRSILAYSPMFHAKLFAESPKYRNSHFEALKEDGEAYLDGNEEFDRPLFVQFCANDPEHLLEGAKQVQKYCDAVDLNLGCPQGIAKRGHYGAFLQEDWTTIHKLIRKLHDNLDIPVTAKMRILETKEKTLEYAKMILDAGASIITVHGRQREQKGHYTGLADWTVLRYLREQLPSDTVMFANGNILQHEDIKECMEATKVDGVMTAEGNLYDPSIFATPPPAGEEGREYWRGRDGKGGYRADAVLRRYLDIIHKHTMRREPPQRAPLFLPTDSPFTQTAEAEAQDDERPAKKQKFDHSTTADSNDTPDDHKRTNGMATNATAPAPVSKKQQKKQQAKEQHKQKENREKVTNANLVAMQAHCFHILRSLVSKHHAVRDALARCKAGDIDAYENMLTLTEAAVKEGLLAYHANPADFEESEDDPPATEALDNDNTESSTEAVRRCKKPYWVCQPYVRPLPKEALEKGSVQLSKKQLRKIEQDRQEERNAGVAAGGKVENVEKDVRREVLSDGDKGVAAGDLRVPKEGMVCG
ncbi:tRNA dihydrouridine synthase [Recurvomyces mirabilis]|uniref:tRNA-dihydrouridine(16/17) synthase [NAD(P)(+)] n=1 Tax=Recurvomyces mirabilis TaxID=574656 RepID=A0AAE0WWB9_9PEZI|nr:tRNA dihydrouridine synthase [Recurvomyces mirabilis]KAK5161155.1 tRNA dihydrouridine synthase [Recurvomyces mirabilis]